MAFFSDLKNSIYNPAYYSEAGQKPLSYSLKYFLLFALLLALVGTFALSFKVIPGIKSVLNIVSEKILQYYPAELEIVIKDGKAETNVQEPYFIPVPSEWQGDSKMPAIENILVIDTKSIFSIEGFQNYKTYCLLTETNIVCYDEDNAIKITSLSEFPDATLNKPLISSIFSKIQPFLKLAYPLIAIFIFMAVFSFYVFRLIYLLFGALVIWMVAYIKKAGIGYKKSYQLGVHLMTAPVIITAVINFFFPHFGFPFFFTILLAVMALLNLREKKITPVQEQSVVTPAQI